MNQDFANTIAQAQSAQTPSTANLGNFEGSGPGGTLANYFANSFRAPTVQAGIGALGVQNQIQVGNQQAQDTFNRNNQISALQTKAAALDPTNPKNYTQTPKADGGYDFKGPGGQPITVQQYAQATGGDPTKILASSTNALDQQYVTDFGNMQSLVNAATSGDTKKLTTLATQLGGNKFAQDIKKMTPHQLITAFMNYYPHVYGVNAGGTDTVAAPGADTVQGGVGGAPAGVYSNPDSYRYLGQ